MKLLDSIDESFCWRSMPARTTTADHPPTDIYDDANAFAGIAWQDCDSHMWQKFPGAIFGFSPYAFCYYLPGAMTASVEDSPDLLVVASIIGMLKRANGTSSCDDFFSERWRKFEGNEYKEVRKWLIWLKEKAPHVLDERDFRSALATIDTLIAWKIGTAGTEMN